MHFPIRIDCIAGYEYSVPHSELAMHVGIAGRRILRVYYKSPSYCAVRVAGDPDLCHGTVGELLPHQLQFPIRSRTVVRKPSL